MHFIKKGAIGPFWWPLPSQIQSIPCNLTRKMKDFAIFLQVSSLHKYRYRQRVQHVYNEY